MLKFIPLFAVILLVSCANVAGKPEPVTRSREVFSSPISLTLYNPQDETVFDQIWQRLDEIDAKMSAHKPDSEISRVSAASGDSPVKVSAETLLVLQSALKMSVTTAGAFDPTIGPITFLWNVTSDNPHVATPAELAERLPLVDYRQVQIDQTASTVFLKKPGMRLDFGGIAKGYAADEAARIARAHGVTSGLLSMGGSTIYALGKKPVLDNGVVKSVNWKIGVQNPEQARGTMIGILEVADTVVESSGPYERFFEREGKRYHHIIDPKTGYPADSGLAQVTLVLPADTDLGDGLSTSCFILGLDKARALIASLPGAAAIFVTPDRKVYLSDSLRPIFKLTDSDFEIQGPSKNP